MTGFNIVSLMTGVWKTAVGSSKLLVTGQILHRISHVFWMQTQGAEKEETRMRAVACACPHPKPLTTRPKLEAAPFQTEETLENTVISNFSMRK